jgi:predicted unusual protein kinase regulating ubiquinone biosynthesis (AarF/ABC1/UbiB family)
MVTHRVEGLVIPKVKWDLTATRVLTTEWIHGARVTTALEKITPQHIRVGVEAFAKMVLDIGFVHADPHAGNVLITTPGDEICLLDFGMVIEVPANHRCAWAQCLYSLVRRDHNSVLNSLIEIGFFPRDCPRDRILKVMPPMWDELVACGSSTQKRKKAVRKCFNELQTFVTELEFDLPDYYIALARAMLTLEGIAIAADVEFDIFEAAFPMVTRHLAKSLATSSGRGALGLLRKCPSRARHVSQYLTCRRVCIGSLGIILAVVAAWVPHG